MIAVATVGRDSRGRFKREETIVSLSYHGGMQGLKSKLDGPAPIDHKFRVYEEFGYWHVKLNDGREMTFRTYGAALTCAQAEDRKLEVRP